MGCSSCGFDNPEGLWRQAGAELPGVRLCRYADRRYWPAERLRALRAQAERAGLRSAVAAIQMRMAARP